jgi:hypothetical protein
MPAGKSYTSLRRAYEGYHYGFVVRHSRNLLKNMAAMKSSVVDYRLVRGLP